MSVEPHQKRTQGEILVDRLLASLSNSDDFYYVSEMRITGRLGTLRPDFVVAMWDVGVAVIEVKDYRRILNGSTQENLKVKKSDGTIFTTTNPEIIARNYATSLADLFSEDPTLMHQYRGKRSFGFSMAGSCYIAKHTSKSYRFLIQISHIFEQNFDW